MEKITKATLKTILKNIMDVMEEEKQFLIELDGSMGDGDLGLTMCSGFQAVYKEIDNIEDEDLGNYEAWNENECNSSFNDGNVDFNLLC